MAYSEIFKEAKRLYNLGFAIHWLHPKSKRPVESGWTTGARKPWKYLADTYKEGMNVGVRTGTPSKIGDKGFLAVVDVDVKGTDDRYRLEALAQVRTLLGENKPPRVSSGRGNGSRHYYCVTSKTFQTFNPAVSKEIIKVLMPSKKPSKKELEELTAEEIKAGWRMGPAWEVSLYSDLRQVVLPPSVHPDSGKLYKWPKALTNIEDLPLIEFSLPEENEAAGKAPGDAKKPARRDDTVQDFKVEPVELAWLDLSPAIIEGIINGTDVIDRSGYLLKASYALLAIGLSKNEILTVLTDPNTFLGACAYDHAKTKNRKRAAQWVWKYTLRGVMEDRDGDTMFANVAEIEPLAKLTGDELEKQTKEKKENLWHVELDRTSSETGRKLKNTMFNIQKVLENTFGHGCFKQNEFANTEELWGDFPWLAQKGKELHDIDLKLLREWFTKEWDMEPSDDKMISAISVIAFHNRYHPVRQWLEKLPAWDNKDRVDNLLNKYIPCEGNKELKDVVGRRFLVALIKRIYEPGCQSDYLLVLEGLQGIQKSSAFRALIGDDWFSDASFNVEDKDAVMVIFSKWLIEFGELSTLDRATAEHTKAFITRRVDRIRAPFDKKARDYPRQCLFVGSTNKDEYLKDDSGNRRYWPFKVTGVCNVDKIKSDREQLFAEALYLYQIGELTYLQEDSLKQLMKEQQEEREMHDVLVEKTALIISSIEKESGEPLDGFQINVLFETGQLTGVRLDQYGTARVGSVLRKLGFTQLRDSVGKRERKWWKKDADFGVMLRKRKDLQTSKSVHPVQPDDFENEEVSFI